MDKKTFYLTTPIYYPSGNMTIVQKIFRKFYEQGDIYKS